MDWKQVGMALGGCVFVLTGGRLVQNVLAGGELFLHWLMFGGLFVLFGVSVVIAAVQTRMPRYRLLGNVVVLGSIGMFAVSGYLAFLSFEALDIMVPFRSTLGHLFFWLGVAGMVLSVGLTYLVKSTRR